MSQALRVSIIFCIWLLLGGSRGVRASVVKDALFSHPQKVSHRDFVILRNGQFRNMRFSYGRPFYTHKSGIRGPEDDFRNLAKAYKGVGRLEDNIYEIERRGLFSGRAKNKFWTYLNSPTYKGGLAQRPSLEERGFAWPDYSRDFRENPPSELFQNGERSRMSAAEKYDYLFGESAFIFNREVSYSNRVYRRLGRIPRWAGICHGTAPASFSYPEPIKGVTVRAYDGSPLQFSAADIKRLSAHLWAENGVPGTQVGRRCSLDELGSRQEDCLDTNPASFHLSLVNYMGIYEKTFILDNAYDSMVWNRPVVSFNYKFKNPISGILTRELKYALEPLSKVENDPYKNHRSPLASQIVGVRMEVELLYGANERSKANRSAIYKIVYHYDLELDRRGKIVGGEWETLYHPDFIWTVKEGESPKVGEDNIIGDEFWDGQEPLGAYVRRLGEKAAKRGELLEYVVRSLVKLSRE